MSYNEAYKTIKSFQYLDEALIEKMKKQGYECFDIEYDQETVTETNLYEYHFRYVNS